MKKSRVITDFPIHERDILEQLCNLDFRPAQEQIRWLIVKEAQERGIITHLPTTTAPEQATTNQTLAVGNGC